MASFKEARREREKLMLRFINSLLIALILSTVLLIDAHSTRAQTSTEVAAAAGRLTPAEAKRIIVARSLQALSAIRRRDMRQLSSFVHPTKGLRFSPYINVQSGDRVFTKSQARNLFSNNRRYLWGEQDGSGDPIRMTARQFFNRYIYDKDFLRAKEVKYNTVTSRGNTINNVLEFYPRAITVEYYLPGTNPRFGGMDWGSLWLIFEKSGNQWYLVGLVSDEWTT